MPKKTTGLGKGSTTKRQAIERMQAVMPDIISGLESGRPLCDVCADLGIHQNTVKAWVRMQYPGSDRIHEARLKSMDRERAEMRKDAESILAAMHTGLSARAACRKLNMNEFRSHSIKMSKTCPDIAAVFAEAVKAIGRSGIIPSPRGGRPTGGMVYFIQGEAGGCIKIGYTGGDPVKRLKDLQTGAPIKLRVIHAVKGSRTDEAWAHHYFRASHSHGEWFWPTRDVMEFIASGVTINAMRHQHTEAQVKTA